mgnify:CR=1 FL=1
MKTLVNYHFNRFRFRGPKRPYFELLLVEHIRAKLLEFAVLI